MMLLCEAGTDAAGLEEEEEEEVENEFYDHDYNISLTKGRKFLNKGRWTKEEASILINSG